MNLEKYRKELRESSFEDFVPPPRPVIILFNNKNLMVKEKLAAVKSQMQELEELISESYYPGEKEEKGNPSPMEY